VLAAAGRGDHVLCQITSNPYSDPLAVEITHADFVEGSLERVSYARPGKLFTASEVLISRQVGLLAPAVRERVVESVVGVLRGTV
jgi:mRNA interferase MazF